LLRLITSRGWTVAGEFVDNDVSATSRKPRPQFDRMMAIVDAGEVDVPSGAVSKSIGESFTTCAFRAPSRRAPGSCRGAAGCGVAAFLHSPSNPRIFRAEQRSIRGVSSQAGPARPPLC
jgi:hypothetical protein